jgi:hypothetical protein
LELFPKSLNYRNEGRTHVKVQIKIIHENEIYIGELELSLEGAEKPLSRQQKVQASVSKGVVTKPSSAVEFLYQKAFFKESRKLSDVVNELQREGYNFSKQAIFMALKAANFLAVTGRRGSYGFIQKFPSSA